MKRVVRNAVLLIAAAVFAGGLAAPPGAGAHCQIPCGIYDDHARVQALLEDADTVIKSARLINELAGKTDAANDRLSLKIARPNDWWFHLRSGPGSHVILQAKSDEEPGRDTLRQAAAIAAYHSKARNARIASVSYTLARYVTKPKGSQPGTVQIRKEQVLKVKPGLPGSDGY